MLTQTVTATRPGWWLKLLVIIVLSIAPPPAAKAINNRDWDFAVSAAILAQTVQPPTLIINEVDYDQPGTDIAEFIELKNVSDVTINLDLYSVVFVNGNGGGASIYQTIDLPSFSLAPGAYYVICGNAAHTFNCNLDLSPDSDLIQNGDPDAVAVVFEGVILDTVSYEGNTGAPYTEGTGASPGDNNTSLGLSLSRFPDMVDTDDNDADWSRRCITPGESNIAASSNCVALALDKVAEPATYDEVGDVINYTYVLTNTGAVTFTSPFTVTDNKTTNELCPQPATLAPNTSLTCMASYTITQTDLDSGSVTNTAQGQTSFSGNPIDSNKDTEIVTAIQNPAIDIQKEGILDLTTVAPADQADVGDVINYTFTVQNIGNVTLDNVTVTDALAGVNCTIGVLLPGATDSTTCSGSYILNQTDLDAGSVFNQAAVSATDPNKESVSDEATNTEPIPQNPAIDIEKTPDYQEVVLGGTASFNIKVTNTGNVTLVNLTITDLNVPDCAAAYASLAPGAVQQYSCTLANVTTDFTNSATATGTPPAGPEVSDTDEADVDVLSFLTVKKELVPKTDPGLFDLRIDNTDIITDVGDGGSTGAVTINAGTHSVSEAAGTDTNLDDYTSSLVCVDAQDEPVDSPGGQVTVTNGDEITCTFTNIRKMGTLRIVKFNDTAVDMQYDGNETGLAGWTFAVTNTTTSHPAGSGLTDANGKLTIADLDPGDYEVCETAQANWFPSTQIGLCQTVTIVAAQTTQAAFGNFKAGIDLEKLTNGYDADSVPGPNIPVGDPVEWSYQVKNTGGVPLSNVMVFDEELNQQICTIAQLDPGESESCTAQGNAVLGQYENKATVIATAPKGNQVGDEDLSHYFGINPLTWSFSCVTHRTEVSGIGMGNEFGLVNPQSLALADPGSINWMLAQLSGRARLPGANVPNSVTFSSNAPQAVTLNSPSTFIDSFGYTFETTLQPTGIISALVSGTGSASFQTPRALALYSNRNVDLNLWSSVGKTLNQFIWSGADPEHAEVVSLPPLSITTDLIITAVVIDNNDDTRPMVVEASAAGITTEIVELGPGLEGDLLNIVVLTLPGVPAGTDEVTITVRSPKASNGDSLAWVGFNVSYICNVDLDVDTIPNNIEGAGDPDGDNQANYLDTESDGDGILDTLEWNSDANGDMVVETSDRDADGDGLLNFLDLDSDNDGQLDQAEGVNDMNNNGILDFLEIEPAGGNSSTLYLPIIVKD